MNVNSCHREASFVTLERTLAELRAIHPHRAASVLGVSVRTVYRWLESKELEGNPRDGGKWVSVRSVLWMFERRYGPTATFDALKDLRDGLRKDQ